MKRVCTLLVTTVFIATAASAAPPPAPAPPAPVATPAPTGPSTAPPVVVAALPARIEFVAFVPVDKAPAEVDLDLRVETVLTQNCNDHMVGLLRRGGAKLDAPDEFDFVVTRDAIGECKKDAVRVGGRQAIRVKLADGQTREIVIGDHAIKVARKGKEVTVNGEGPAGDVPGAPPTGRPSVLVAGEVVSAKQLSAHRTKPSPWMVATELEVNAKWPACASAPIGLLGRGDASSHFALARFQPIARAAQDESCKPVSASTVKLGVTVQMSPKAAEQQITVGKTAVAIKPN